MPMNSLNDLFVHELRDLYSAERQIADALPRLADAASHPELRSAFEQHLETTREQVRRLEQIGDELQIELDGQRCRGMEGLIEEGREVLEEEAEPSVRDAALISAAQRVEHYEISAYGTARAFAERLGHDEAARMLQVTLDEESNTDERLTALAENIVNPEAEA